MRVKVTVEALVDAPDGVKDAVLENLRRAIERHGLGAEDDVAITKVTVEEFDQGGE